MNPISESGGTNNSKAMQSERDYISHYDSPLGGITISSNGAALTGLWFDGQKHFGSTLARVREERTLPVFDATKRWLEVYFRGMDPGSTPPLYMKTTPFRMAVWEILLTIPFGRTMTYGEIARILAERKGLRRMSAQAVGGAVSHNSIALIIPCHRVVGANGNLTGYAGGIERKLRLLKMEGASRNAFFIPENAPAE